MFIQQSIQMPVGLVQELPSRLIANMAIGQQIEAIVVNPEVAAKVASIRVADTLLNIKMPHALQQGQSLLLELVMKEGKPGLQLVSTDTSTTVADKTVKTDSVTATSPQPFKLGQQIAVEVVKTLANNKVLIQTPVDQGKQQIEIDISRLSQSYQVGDKASIKIISQRPLQVYLEPKQAPNQQAIVAEKVSQLLKQQVDKPSLEKVLQLVSQQKMPDSVKQPVDQIVKNSLDQAAVTQSQALKQALLSSGTFTEKQLLSDPTSINKDFKANMAKVISALTMIITEAKLTNQGDVKALLNKLPAQVQTALASTGRTPAQLLSVLLSPPSRPSTMPTISMPLTPIITNSEQAILLSQTLTKSALRQMQVNLAELQALFKDVEGVHSKLQLNQLLSVKDPETTTTQASWLFDLPIKDKQNLDLVQLQIDQEQQNSNQAEADDIWSVQLRLETQNLGPLQAMVTLQAETVNIVFTAQLAESAELLNQHLDLLHNSIEKLDLTVAHASCNRGEVVQSLLTQHPVYQDSTLVDVSV